MRWQVSLSAVASDDFDRGHTVVLGAGSLEELKDGLASAADCLWAELHKSEAQLVMECLAASPQVIAKH